VPARLTPSPILGHAQPVSNSHIVIDIETILDPELPILESSEAERLPAPPHHLVVALGALWLDDHCAPRKLGVFGELKQEAGILSDFARFIEDRRPLIITWNGRSFDMPVIASRCLRHGITLCHYYESRDVRYRFSAQGHLDLMDYLADYGAAKPAKLDVFARLVGMPGKVGLAGKDVGPLVHAGRLQEVRNYCLCDVVQTAGIFLRVQLLRGNLNREQYGSAMAALVALIRQDPRVADVDRAMNEPRLMLQEPTNDKETQ
jgi:predicted PolB exonuclease-like 3'-5' exonuclease